MVDQDSEGVLRRAIELFYFAYREFTAGADRMLEQRGLSRVHHRILYFVGRQPELSMKELLATLAVSKQALNAPLRQLIEMGLVMSGGDELDGRVRRLRLSREGVRLEARLTASQVDLIAAAFQRAGDAGASGWLEVTGHIASGRPAAKPTRPVAGPARSPGR